MDTIKEQAANGDREAQEWLKRGMRFNMHKKYIGIKVVEAYPAEKDGKQGYKVIYEDGYESWSPKEVFEKSYREVEGNDLLMTSLDMMTVGPDGFKARARAEYNQLRIRMEKLRNMLNRYQSGALDFKPNCSYDLLHAQYVFMEQYKAVLEERAKIENVDL